jgi:hypothetical protein
MKKSCLKGEWKSDENTGELFFQRIPRFDEIRRYSIRGGNERGT